MSVQKYLCVIISSSTQSLECFTCSTCRKLFCGLYEIAENYTGSGVCEAERYATPECVFMRASLAENKQRFQDTIRRHCDVGRCQLPSPPLTQNTVQRKPYEVSEVSASNQLKRIQHNMQHRRTHRVDFALHLSAHALELLGVHHLRLLELAVLQKKETHARDHKKELPYIEASPQAKEHSSPRIFEQPTSRIILRRKKLSTISRFSHVPL